MSDTHRKWQGGNADEATSGLEGHLRSLILTNAPPDGRGISNDPVAAPYPYSQPPLSQYPPPGMDGPASPLGPESGSSPASGQAAPRSPKPANRRRPNQAQRRQMKSHFTILPEFQPQRPFQNYQFQSDPQPQHQRPRTTTRGPQPQPPQSSWPRDYDVPRSHGSWRGQSVHSTPSMSSQPRQQQQQQQPWSHGRAVRHGSMGSFPNQRGSHLSPQEIASQGAFLDSLCHQVVSSSEIDRAEIAQKEAFRQRIENISRQVITHYEQEFNGSPDFSPSSVVLKCFGSLSSGFATKDSDMDLGLLSPLSKFTSDAPGSPIPRLLEKAFLDAGLGARLLTRTRVPIIKMCEFPPEKLRQGLLAQREKWEHGLDIERPDGTADEPNHDGPPQGGGGGDDDDDDDGNCEHPRGTDLTGGADPASVAEFEIPDPQGGGVRRFRLQQKSNSSLSSYYLLAKTILRRAGGRDVTAANYRDFSSHDWLVLNRLCQAFVGGLYDPQLRQRISQYPSLSFDDASDFYHHRSLAGFFTQIEGERILQSWSEWPDKDLLEMILPQDSRALSIWAKLQSRAIPEIDPISYNKELQLALDHLKQRLSIRVFLIEQGDQETASEYHARAQAIIETLPVGQELLGEARRAVVERYVSGIHNRQIRSEVAAYLKNHPEQSGFQALGCRHRSFHLAHELERAVNRGLYHVDKADSILRYIEILRSPLRQAFFGNFVVAIPPEDSSVMAIIRSLEDPRSILPKQARDRYHDPLEFPKTGIGAQCDINFSAQLALQNTRLLRCYSHTDPRVRPMVLFVKRWAKVRGINSGYRGTLSSYGYVLMVLHYLVNIAQPFVCPNLQQLAPPTPPNLSPAEVEETVTCRGYDVRFWRNEEEIIQFALSNQLNSNTESIGDLLRGFFEYYAQNGMMSNVRSRGFEWGRDVISLRTHGGLLTKREKGWTGAKTVFAGQNAAPADQAKTAEAAAGTGKDAQKTEVRLRFLFAIEDPFEIDHNVARTVTHNGIVSIRDEFRRAWRIIQAAGKGEGNVGEDLLQDVNDVVKGSSDFEQVLREIHGW